MHKCAYTGAVAYEWNAAKARANLAKHGVRFSDATTALEDDWGFTVRDDSSDEEERWLTLGRDSAGRLLVVVYAWRGDQIRLISARMATARERGQYEEHNET